jgi:hypothetical protein
MMGATITASLSITGLLIRHAGPYGSPGQKVSNRGGNKSSSEVWDARQSRRLHLYGNDCGTHMIDNIGKKTGGKMGNFTLGCRRVGRQVQTTTARATAATIRRDVARITRRRRQIRGGEIIFSDRRDRMLDMV